MYFSNCFDPLVVLAPAAGARDRGDTDLFALIPKPGFPAHAYVGPNGLVYEGTYDNPAGDTMPSIVRGPGISSSARLTV